MATLRIDFKVSFAITIYAATNGLIALMTGSGNKGQMDNLVKD